MNNRVHQSTQTSRLKAATPLDRYKRWRSELERWRGVAALFWGAPLALALLLLSDFVLPSLGLTRTAALQQIFFY